MGWGHIDHRNAPARVMVPGSTRVLGVALRLAFESTPILTPASCQPSLLAPSSASPSPGVTSSPTELFQDFLAYSTRRFRVLRVRISMTRRPHEWGRNHASQRQSQAGCVRSEKE